MFCNCCENFENSKWLPFLTRQNFFENWNGYSAEIFCGSKISSKSLYLARFSRYKHFSVLQFLRKIRKFKMGYCIHLPTLKRIHRTVTELRGKENAEPAEPDILPCTIKPPAGRLNIACPGKQDPQPISTTKWATLRFLKIL